MKEINGSASQQATNAAERPGRARKRVLLLEFEDYAWLGDLYTDFLSRLRGKADVQKIDDVRTAVLALKTDPRPDAVLFFEPSIMKDANVLFAKEFVGFTRQGGSVIFACTCSSFATPPDIDRFFKEYYELPWKSGSYLRTTFTKNPAMRLDITPHIHDQVSMKALHLDKVADEDLVYKTSAESVTESLVWAPQRVELKGEGPVVFAQHHKGRLGWVGDVNNEEATTPLIMAMLGL